jgi:hypothetical protein
MLTSPSSVEVFVVVMLDRVARSIYEKAQERLLTGDQSRPESTWDHADQTIKRIYVELAQAALEPLLNQYDGALSDIGGRVIRKRREESEGHLDVNVAWHAFLAMIEAVIFRQDQHKADLSSLSDAEILAEYQRNDCVRGTFKAEALACEIERRGLNA